MTEKLNESQLHSALADLPQWRLEQGELVQWKTFSDFLQAMKFVNAVASLAEKAGHHPDIDIRYNRVRLALTTHDSGGITSNDTQMAQAIDAVPHNR